jgi:hypothetical protein
MFRHYRVIHRELVIKIMTNKYYKLAILQIPWGWHDSVEICRSVMIYEIIVHLLVSLDYNLPEDDKIVSKHEEV